jgi:hypothetical protein
MEQGKIHEKLKAQIEVQKLGRAQKGIQNDQQRLKANRDRNINLFFQIGIHPSLSFDCTINGF